MEAQTQALSKPKKHIDSLDGWRGVAILLVFLLHYVPHRAHTALALVVNVGWTGVDLFLALSGFLITGILYDTRRSSNFFRAFYARRALRLFPLYFAAVMVVIVGTHFLRGFRVWQEIPFFIYGANIMSGISSRFAVFPPYLNCYHFWSLALEEQFYSIWPIFVFLIPERRTLIKVSIAGIVIAFLVRVGCVVFHAPLIAVYMQLPVRMDSLLAGSLLALLLRGPNPGRWVSPKKLRVVLALSTICFLAACTVSRSTSWDSAAMMAIGGPAVAWMSTSILGLALAGGTAMAVIGRNNLLRFYGRYSYGLYVWHFLPAPLTLGWINTFETRIHPLYLADIIYTVSMLALFTSIAVLSFHLFEQHFLKLKSKFRYTAPTPA